MAREGMGSLITLGVLGVGGYFLYEWLKSQCATSGTSIYGGTICGTLGWGAAAAPVQAQTQPLPSNTPAPPPVAAVPTAMQVLTAAAATNTIIQGQQGKADAYQWATLWNAAYPSAPLPDINATFYPNGLPTVNLPAAAGGGTQVQLPLMSLSDWLAKIKAAGVTVAGMSGLAGNLIPAYLIHRGGWA